MKAHQISAISGVIILLLGGYHLVASPAASASSYIIPAIGVLFLGASPAIKKDNRTVAHIVVVFTLVLAAFSGYKAYQASLLTDETLRETEIQVFSALAISCTGAFIYYLQGFIERKKTETQKN